MRETPKAISGEWRRRPGSKELARFKNLNDPGGYSKVVPLCMALKSGTIFEVQAWVIYHFWSARLSHVWLKCALQKLYQTSGSYREVQKSRTDWLTPNILFLAVWGDTWLHSCLHSIQWMNHVFLNVVDLYYCIVLSWYSMDEPCISNAVELSYLFGYNRRCLMMTIFSSSS